MSVNSTNSIRNPTSIPLHIYQTHKSLDYIKRNPKINNAIESWKKVAEYNKWQYHFFDNSMCDTFIKNHMPGRVQRAYFSLPLPVMRADLWRYCIIWKYGGIYADADTEFIAPRHFLSNIFPFHLHNQITQLYTVPENSTHLCQWVFAAPQKSPLLWKIIQLSVHRILNERMTGEHFIHYFTGPGVFTDAILNAIHVPPATDKNILATKHVFKTTPLCVVRAHPFHSKFVKHYFTGSSPGGWFKDRENYLRHKKK
jgi:mannosyltransferase OCH1-like enzyme